MCNTEGQYSYHVVKDGCFYWPDENYCSDSEKAHEKLEEFRKIDGGKYELYRGELVFANGTCGLRPKSLVLLDQKMEEPKEIPGSEVILELLQSHEDLDKIEKKIVEKDETVIEDLRIIFDGNVPAKYWIEKLENELGFIMDTDEKCIELLEQLKPAMNRKFKKHVDNAIIFLKSTSEEEKHDCSFIMGLFKCSLKQPKLAKQISKCINYFSEVIVEE